MYETKSIKYRADCDDSNISAAMHFAAATHMTLCVRARTCLALRCAILSLLAATFSSISSRCIRSAAASSAFFSSRRRSCAVHYCAYQTTATQPANKKNQSLAVSL
jgi:hypothetical protein